MAIDPRIILGLQGVNTGQALQQGQQGLQNVLALQQAQQNQALTQQGLQAGQQKLQQQEGAQQQIAEAKEFKTNIQPFIGTDPFKALENVQNSTVLDDDDKQQIITAINAEASGNPAPLQALTQLTDRALGATGGKAEQFTLSPGQTRFQGGTPIAFGGSKPDELSGVQKKVLAEGLDPNSPQGQARAKELNQRAATSPGLRSDLEILGKANRDQLLAAGFANRVSSANNDFIGIENTPGFDPTSVNAAVLQNIPGGNLALTEDQQLYQRSKVDFITAVLRLESGAAIGQDEFVKEDKKFFPQPGDKPRVVEAKRKARDRAFQNLKNQSKGVFDVQFKGQSEGVPQGLPAGTVNNNDGTFTLPTGERVEPN